MDKLSVIKIGGNVLDDPASLERFLTLFAEVPGRKILVHGGGKIATRIGEKLGITSRYVNGRRITDTDTRDLVTMVYGGLVNRQLVAQLQAKGCNAIGLTGADGGCIPADKRPEQQTPDGPLDFGWVGDIRSGRINVNFFSSLLEQGCTPVLSPLTHDGQGHLLNTNADTIASSVAVALSEMHNVRLLYCFEKRGILTDVEDEQSVITRLDHELYARLLAEKKLFDGILPKIDNAFAAIRQGVREVLIGHADDLPGNLGETTKGTLIV